MTTRTQQHSYDARPNMDYAKHTRDKLIAMCKEHNIKGYSGKKKVDLIHLLQNKNNVIVNRPVTRSSVKGPFVEKALQTEDTGKCFEMGICLAYGIHYDGKFKYSMDVPERLKARLARLPQLFPLCRHTAKRGSRYDFTALSDETKHLSAKSTKKGLGKVAPQVIGQSQPRKFCEIMGIEFTSILSLKHFIQNNIVKIIPILVQYTFDCPNIYFNQNQDTIRYITLSTPIECGNCSFRWTCGWMDWKNSSTLNMILEGQEYALLEFQFHSTNRTNMAIRWVYENVLTLFKKNFCIIDL